MMKRRHYRKKTWSEPEWVRCEGQRLQPVTHVTIKVQPCVSCGARRRYGAVPQSVEGDETIEPPLTSHQNMEIKMYDTVSLPYVIGRIDDVLKKFSPEDHEHGMGDAWCMHEGLQELRHELIYNMGVNSLNRQKETST